MILAATENNVLLIPEKNGTQPIKLMHFPTPSPVSTLGGHMTKLAWEPNAWDVLVVCAGEDFKGNSVILTRVPFFEAALADGFQEGAAARVEIREAGIAAFRAVWHYIYTDDCARISELQVAAELLDGLSLAQRFELPVVALASSRRLIELVPTLPPDVLVHVFRVAKLHEQAVLREACHHRMGEIGVVLLEEDGVFEIISTDKILYKEVLSACSKRRRTI
jgi:hypothetical protein